MTTDIRRPTRHERALAIVLLSVLLAAIALTVMTGCGSNKEYVRTHSCYVANHINGSTVVLDGFADHMDGRTYFVCEPDGALVVVSDEKGKQWRP